MSIPTRSLVRPRPGTYYYLYMLNSYKPWESHPFTLKSWEDETQKDGVKRTSELSFLLRPHSGFTARLRKSTLKQKAAEKDMITVASIRMVIEGPYGTSFDVSRYSSVLFIIGGSGITVALSYLQALRESIYQTKKVNHPRLHSIRLVWAVHSAALFEDVYRHDLSQFHTSSSFSEQFGFLMDIYITGQENFSIVPSQASAPENILLEAKTEASHKDAEILTPQEQSSGTLVEAYRDLKINRNRPAVHDLILGCAEEWQATQDKTAIVCCGPGAMVDDARAAAVSAVSKGYDNIDFHPEMFHW